MAGRAHILILHSGGLRSLVATAMVLNRPDAARLSLLHVHDGRTAGPRRLEHLRQQADYYGLKTPHELNLPHLFGRPSAQQPDGLPRATLAGPQLVLMAYAHAMDQHAAELHWPQAVDGQVDAMAATMETQILVQQMAEAQPTPGEAEVPLPELALPLVGYSDVQVVELGGGLGVPWELAWSCVMNSPIQCGSCPACRRRHAAFRAAGVVDAAFDPAAQR